MPRGGFSIDIPPDVTTDTYIKTLTELGFNVKLCTERIMKSDFDNMGSYGLDKIVTIAKEKNFVPNDNNIKVVRTKYSDWIEYSELNSNNLKYACTSIFLNINNPIEKVFRYRSFLHISLKV